MLWAQAKEEAQALTSWALVDPGEAGTFSGEHAEYACLMTVLIHLEIDVMVKSDLLSSLNDTKRRRLAGDLRNFVLLK